MVSYWHDKARYTLLLEMCSDMSSGKPRHDIFVPGRTGGRLPVGASPWHVVAFHIPTRELEASFQRDDSTLVIHDTHPVWNPFP